MAISLFIFTGVYIVLFLIIIIIVSKYDDIPASFMFQLVALETLGPINESALRFVENLGRRISAVSSEAHEGVFLFQRLSVLMQCFNAIFVRDSFTRESSYAFSASYPSQFRLSVCLSHGWIRQKRCKLGSPNLHRRLPGRL